MCVHNYIYTPVVWPCDELTRSIILYGRVWARHHIDVKNRSQNGLYDTAVGLLFWPEHFGCVGWNVIFFFHLLKSKHIRSVSSLNLHGTVTNINGKLNCFFFFYLLNVSGFRTERVGIKLFYREEVPIM